MADDADIASAYIENEVSRAVGKIRQNQHYAPGTMGAKTCVECGEDIPDPRRQLGFKICVTCAEEAERRKSRFADY